MSLLLTDLIIAEYGWYCKLFKIVEFCTVLLLDLPSGTTYPNICVILNFR